MRLIGRTCGLALLFAAHLSAQAITTTTTEKTTFEVKGGRNVTVTGCVARFSDAGYMLTDETGDLKYVLVTNDNLSRLVGRRVEVHGLSADGDAGKITIERVVGTSGQIGGEKIDGETTKRTKEVTGDVGFPYVGVKSVKQVARRCK
jgi:hypothetical protein